MNNQPKNAGIIDNYFTYPVANLFVDLAYKLGLTPNNITTITMLLRIIALYNLYHKKNYYLVFILYFISWITDALDGSLARKYNLKSEFGAIYDMFIDIISTIILISILYLKFYKNNKLIINSFIIILILYLISFYIKLQCFNGLNLKFWEREIKKINIFNINSSSKICEYNNIFKLNDAGLTYVIIMSILYYTLFIHKTK